MSEVKLNLVDAEQTLVGTVHGSIADACVAALSAEPETIAQLEAALARYVKPLDNSLIEYESRRLHCRKERAACPPLDARDVLYGRALLEFIVMNVRQTSVCCERADYDSLQPVGHADNSSAGEAVDGSRINDSDERPASEDDPIQEAIANEISAIHARWLMTPRDDLRGQSPRDILLAKREFIDFDLHTRELQWALQGEEPPCLAEHSLAHRCAGFGTHECVVYYDLVRHLLWNALTCQRFRSGDSSPQSSTPMLTGTDCHRDRIEAELSRLEKIKTNWLENSQPDYGGRTPANIIGNERRRLPLALSKREMIIDEDCYTCMMMANDPTMGPGFWHLDGSHMDEDFAFTDFLTREEWEAENRRREEFNKEFNRRWEERQQRLARGEQVDDEFRTCVTSSFAAVLLTRLLRTAALPLVVVCPVTPARLDSSHGQYHSGPARRTQARP